MVDITINGVISFPNTPNEFAKDFNDLLGKYSAHFKGQMRSYEFDDAEVIDDEKMDD
jgi:hypothetical protein